MNGHTPGPWTDKHPYSTPEWAEVGAGEYHSAFKHASLSIGQGDKLLAEVRAQTPTNGYPHVECIEEMRANARLIAAAPDLLAALQAIADLPGEVNTANYSDDDVRALNNAHIEAYQIAVAAIAKAGVEA